MSSIKQVYGVLWVIGLFSFSHISLVAQEVKIAHASSLIPVIELLTEEMRDKYGISIVSIPGPSGSLTNQLLNGAPYDIFISASPEFCKRLDESGISTNSEYNVFSGGLAIWSSVQLSNKTNGLVISLKEQIEAETIETLAVASPDIAPYGAQAIRWINANVPLAESNTKLIYGESISIINQYISTASVEMAITSESSRIALGDSLEGWWYSLPEKQDYWVNHCLSRISKNEKGRETVLFILSEEFLEQTTTLGYSRHFTE